MTQEILDRISQLHPSIKIDVQPGENLDLWGDIYANVHAESWRGQTGLVHFNYNQNHPKNKEGVVGWSVKFRHRRDLGFLKSTPIRDPSRVNPILYIGTDPGFFCRGWFRYIEMYITSSMKYDQYITSCTGKSREIDYSWVRYLPHPLDIHERVIGDFGLYRIRSIHRS